MHKAKRSANLAEMVGKVIIIAATTKIAVGTTPTVEIIITVVGMETATVIIATGTITKRRSVI